MRTSHISLKLTIINIIFYSNLNSLLLILEFCQTAQRIAENWGKNVVTLKMLRKQLQTVLNSQNSLGNYPKMSTLTLKLAQTRGSNQGWQWGGVGRKDGVFFSVLHGFVLRHPRPVPHDEKNFLTPSPPLRATRIPTLFRKILLLVNLPTTITIVFNKTCFVNKNIFEITNKFISSNQTNFQQKLNNIFKVFNKKISQQKQKSHNTKSLIQQYINLFIIKTKENVKIGTLFPTLLEKKKRQKSLLGRIKQVNDMFVYIVGFYGMEKLQFNPYQCKTRRVGPKKFKPITAPPCDARLKSHPIPAPPPLQGGKNQHGAKREGVRQNCHPQFK